jgi:hypothetical protein
VPDELTSWKEIANYLKVTVRTAQLWEANKGLPVRRLPGGRGRVLAVAKELDAWKRSGPGPQNGATDPVAPVRVRQRRGRIVIAVLVLLLSMGIVIGAWVSLHRGVPSHLRVERNVLAMLDARGAVMWRYPFDRDLIASLYVQQSPNEGTLAQIADVDGDGELEALFVQRVGCSDCPGQNKLYCFSDAGTVEWTFAPGRDLTTASGYHVANSFAVTNVVVLPGRAKGVLVVAAHNTEEFCQISLVSPTGSLLREYWHVGHLGNTQNSAVIGDPDGDGVNLLYLSGISNPRRAATLVVLDPETMDGASKEDAPQKQLSKFATGRERARIFFPRSCVNIACGGPYNHGRQITLSPGVIGVEVNEGCNQGTGSVHYAVRPTDFTVTQVGFADSFKLLHDRLQTEEGKIDHAFVEAVEAERLLRSVWNMPVH